MKKGDIIAFLILGALETLALILSNIWYQLYFTACVLCCVKCLCIALYLWREEKREEKQQIKNAEFIKPDNKKDFDIYVKGMFPCDACGKNPKAQNSQLCKECQDKVNGDK